jgi:predicted methyltransferase
MSRNLLIGSAALLAMLQAGELGAADRIPPYVSSAIHDSARPETDKERDADRKPAETVSFAGIKPGDTVGELIPGGGYYTRILSQVVGPKGHVYAMAPARRADAPADQPDYSAGAKAVAADPHYSNVSMLVQTLATFALPSPVDVVWTSQNYHDVHNIPNADLAAFNKRAFDALKPGGEYLVIDHAAEAGSGARDTQTLHRIDPATVKSEALAAGFVLESQSDLLKNPNDPHTAKVFDPSIRGKTDQFILKFRKPKGRAGSP